MTLSISRSLPAVIAAGLFAFAGCASNSKGTGGTAVNSDADQVVATYGTGTKITLKQVDESITDELADLEKKKFQARRQTIDRLILEALVKAEAAKKGQKEEEWIKAEIESKIPDPPEEEIADFFAKNQAQMPPGSTLETIRPQLIGYLKQNKGKEVATRVFDDLKKANNVVVTFKEPAKPKKVVEAKGPAKGPDGAKVTIVEFSDFQCPFCSRAIGTVDQVMEQYAGKVRLVFRQFPLDFHEKAPKAAQAGLCANEQGKFWEMHDAMFKDQSKIDVDGLKATAVALGMDAAKFNDCLDSGKMKKAVDEDIEAGKKVGVNGTPAFFINGSMLSGAQPLEAFKEVIDTELAAK
jgi:protein-disulfide isomerase